MRLQVDVDWDDRHRFVGAVRSGGESGLTFEGILELVGAIEHFLGPEPHLASRDTSAGGVREDETTTHEEG